MDELQNWRHNVTLLYLFISVQFQCRVILLNHNVFSLFRIAKSVRGKLLNYSAFTDDGVAVVVPETQIVVEMDRLEHRINSGVSCLRKFSEPGDVPL